MATNRKSTVLHGNRADNTKKSSEHRKALLATLTIVLISIMIVAYVFLQQQSSQPEFVRTAVIVDQLSQDLPNQAFSSEAASIFEQSGFTTIYQSNVGVEFFRNLTATGYGIIVLRAHSAIREDNSTVDIFTSEPFSDSAYLQEQSEGLVVHAWLNYSGTRKDYFAVSSAFIENLRGHFAKSIVVAMGCSTLGPGLDQLARAFVDRGAKAYTGWTKAVEYQHTDNETLEFLRNLLIRSQSISEASRVGVDPIYGSAMAYYPTESGDLKVSDLLLTGAQSSASLFPAAVNKIVIGGSSTLSLGCPNCVGQAFEAPRDYSAKLTSKVLSTGRESL